MTVHDITRPTVLLTGPTSGIGAATLTHLIRHPARPTVVLMGRDATAVDVAVARARSAGLAAVGVRLDLADLASVRAAADEVSRLIDAGDIGALDAVVLNAGAQYMNRRQQSAQGWELTFAVNVIAQHALLRLLEPRLASNGHIVLLGSSTHRGKKQSFKLVPDPEWQSPAALALAQPAATGRESAAAERVQGGIAYASSKLALVTLAHEWAERLATGGRRLNTYDPGLVVGTGLVRDMPAYRYLVWKYLMPVMALHPKATLPRITGRHLAELALGDAHATLHDGYVEIGTVTAAEPITVDRERRRMLWSWLEETVATTPPAARASSDGADGAHP